jgi:hypothetical protein
MSRYSNVVGMTTILNLVVAVLLGSVVVVEAGDGVGAGICAGVGTGAMYILFIINHWL